METNQKTPDIAECGFYKHRVLNENVVGSHDLEVSRVGSNGFHGLFHAVQHYQAVEQFRELSVA